MICNDKAFLPKYSSVDRYYAKGDRSKSLQQQAKEILHILQSMFRVQLESFISHINFA